MNDDIIEGLFFELIDRSETFSNEQQFLSSLSEEVKTIYVTKLLYNEINNGGFLQALGINQTRELFKEASIAFEVMNLKKVSELIIKARKKLESLKFDFAYGYEISDIEGLYKKFNLDDLDNLFVQETMEFEEILSEYYNSHIIAIRAFFKNNK
ncbi:MAG: DUF4375 domain-containing protein [Acholeplasma sp.]|nr:DUF4375 domain-containing protein [Acholeplasma sp.]